MHGAVLACNHQKHARAEANLQKWTTWGVGENRSREGEEMTEWEMVYVWGGGGGGWVCALASIKNASASTKHKHATPHRVADECVCIACVGWLGKWDRGWGGACPRRTLKQRVGVHAKVVSGLQLRQGVRLGLQVAGDVGQQLLRLLQLQSTLRRGRGRRKGCAGVGGLVWVGQTKERETNAWAHAQPPHLTLFRNQNQPVLV